MTQTPLVVLVLVDALGYDLVGPTDWLAAELPHRRPLDTVLGFSAGAIPSLLSGTWPAENGHWVMFHRDPARSPFKLGRLLARMPARVRNSWRVRQWVKARAGRNIHGYFSLYEVPWEDLSRLDVCERENLFRPGGLGTIGTIFDDARHRRLTLRAWDWRSDDDTNEREFAAALAAGAAPGAPDVLFYYTAAVDALMHEHGTTAAPVRERLARLAGVLEEGLARVRAGGREAWCYLTSDHGMHDVHGRVDVMSAVERAGFRRGSDYEAFYDSTMARFWFHGPLAEAGIRAALEGLPGRWLSREDEERLGFHFADRRYGQAIFLLDEGRLLVPSFMGSRPVAAMHGYDPGTSASRAVLLSSRPIPDGVHHVTDFRAFFNAELDARQARALADADAGAAAGVGAGASADADAGDRP
jgi:hypothetical protein